MALKLFKISKKITLSFINNGVRNSNLSFTEQDFKVYKGADFSIDFVVINNDRKPVTLVGKTLMITILEHQSKTAVIQKELTITDEVKGKAKLSLTPAETVDLELGFYDYSVIVKNEDGTQNVLFTDQDREGRGWFEIKDGILPTLVDAQETASGSDWTPYVVGQVPNEITRYSSGPLNGDASLGYSDGLHTIAIYTTDFTGKMWIQGSIAQVAPSGDDDWFDIHITPNTFELQFTDSTGIEPFNFTANVSWIRFVYEPDNLNTGTVDKVLLKS